MPMKARIGDAAIKLPMLITQSIIVRIFDQDNCYVTINVLQTPVIVSM